MSYRTSDRLRGPLCLKCSALTYVFIDLDSDNPSFLWCVRCKQSWAIEGPEEDEEETEEAHWTHAI